MIDHLLVRRIIIAYVNNLWLNEVGSGNRPFLLRVENYPDRVWVVLLIAIGHTCSILFAFYPSGDGFSLD